MFKKNKYVTEQQLDHITNLIDRRLTALDSRTYGRDDNYVYNTVVGLLIEAGILVENTEEPKPTVRWQGTKYNVRKVK